MSKEQVTGKSCRNQEEHQEHYWEDIHTAHWCLGHQGGLSNQTK